MVRNKTYLKCLFVFGGSIAKFFRLFEQAIYEGFNDFPYPNSVKKLKILTSDLQYTGVLGTSTLCLEK